MKKDKASLLEYYEKKARESKDPMIRAQQKWIDGENGDWIMIEIGDPERYAVQ